MTDTNNEELRKNVEAWYEESFEIDLKAARANWPGNRCGADDAIDELLRLITSRDQQIALAAKIGELEKLNQWLKDNFIFEGSDFGIQVEERLATLKPQEKS